MGRCRRPVRRRTRRLDPHPPHPNRKHPLMFYEIRRYQVQPGRRDEWVRYMAEAIIPFQVSKGVSVTATFITDDDPDGYVWIRRFDDEAQRIALNAAVYDSERWTSQLGLQCEQFLIPEQATLTRVIPVSDAGLAGIEKAMGLG
ncbi:NIPSNAP family protein [Nocardia sp. CA-119907]|uniref:NIPSNAP family protein n=1 Tax=Nocardia sp. CA-119907 TaxID=3239973 RepID=UPI003D97BE98